MDVRPIDANALVEHLERISNNYTEIYERLEAGDPSKAVIYGKFTAIVETMIDVNRMPTIDYAPKWISVKDRLPMGMQNVLMFIDCRGVMIGYYSPIDKLWSYEGWLPVTHWMPLPEPPKEE